MIQIDIDHDEVKDSIKIKELYEYLLSKGHDISANKKSIPGAKVDLLIGIAIATLAVNTLSALYPIIKDLQNWVRPRRYSISITDDNITGSANDLTEYEYLQLVKQLDKKKTKIEITAK